jgi:hypothetical protein
VQNFWSSNWACVLYFGENSALPIEEIDGCFIGFVASADDPASGSLLKD